MVRCVVYNVIRFSRCQGPDISKNGGTKRPAGDVTLIDERNVRPNNGDEWNQVRRALEAELNLSSPGAFRKVGGTIAAMRTLISALEDARKYVAQQHSPDLL